MEPMRYERRMSDADALMWVVESDPRMRSTITSILVLDRLPDRAGLEQTMERASRVIPRLRQRVRSNPLSLAPPRWETDPNFDLAYHLRWRAPGEGTIRDLFDVAEPMAMQGFDRARPLWEMAVVDGLAGGRAGVVVKLHHAITDGVGGVRIALEVFDLEREGSDRQMPEEPEVRVLNQAERLIDAVDHETRRGQELARRAINAVGGAVERALSDPAAVARRLNDVASSVGRLLQPATRPLSTAMAGRSLSVRFDHLQVPLDDLKRAAKGAEARLNDAFVASVLGGLARYHARHHDSADTIRLAMPISIRSDDTANLAGNQFVPTRFLVPLGVVDPAERMRAVRDVVGGVRREPALGLVEPLSGVIYRLPRPATVSLFGSMLQGVDFVASNVPGAPLPLFLAGARIEQQVAFGPISGSAGNITLFSYVDQAHIGVATDPAAIADRDAFLADLEAGFQEIATVG
jgi:WS/DGAT/MGAT family acyltransferase